MWAQLWIKVGAEASAVRAVSALEKADSFFLAADLGSDGFQAAAKLVDLHGDAGERVRPTASRPVLFYKGSKVGMAVKGGPARPRPVGNLLEADRLA